jgi:hypothetical protein
MFAALGGAASAHALASQPCSARAIGLQRDAAQQELQQIDMQSSVNIKVKSRLRQQPLIKKNSGLRRRRRRCVMLLLSCNNNGI